MPVDSQIDTCPNDVELHDIFTGELPTNEMARLMRHITQCEQCLTRLRTNEPAAQRAGAEATAVKHDTVGSGVHPDRSIAGTAANLPAVAGEGAAGGAVENTHRPEAAQKGKWCWLLAPSDNADELGRLGSYRVLRVLGEGGMGVVFEAEDPTLKRRVAIKVLRRGEIDSSERERFLQEAQLAAALSSDRIVTIHQVGDHDGCLFIVMELLAGETLESRLKRESSLPLAESLRIAREVAEGLALAHERHLVHRDIKPANVWLEDRRPVELARRVKLLDFGLARPVSVHNHLTVSGNIVGTPCYMSPEQACGMPVDQRSDLFSLGCLLYALLAGRSPFERCDYIQTLKAVVDEKPRPLSTLLPGLPPRVEQLVDRMLAKDAASRPANARLVIAEIRQLEQSLTSTGMVTPELTNLSSSASQEAVRPKLGLAAWAGAFTVLAAVLLGSWGLYGQLTRSADESAPAETKTPAHALAASHNGDSDDAARSTSDNTPAAADADPAAAPAELPTIKIGIIHSLSGAMAVSERSIVDAYLMAVRDINSQGGLLGGRQIEAIVRDGKSNERVFAEQAEELVSHENVVTLFGCWRSPCRKAVETVVRRHEHLLVYPVTYEGLEDSPYVIYLGGAPNQQVLPAVKYAFAFLGRRKFFLIGADGIYSHTVHAIIHDELDSLGARVVGEAYRPLGDTAFDSIARNVAASGADVVINTVSGSGNVSLFHSLRQAGITSDKIPTISLKIGEEELRNVTGNDQDLVGDYAVWSYFQSLQNQENLDFVETLHQQYGTTRVASDPMAAAYAAIFLWARAVDSSQSDRVIDIRKTMLNENFEAPEGELVIDRANHHAWRRALIGQVNSDLQFDIVWASPRPIEPEPFPSSRPREEWRKFQHELYKKWNGHWYPTADK